MCKRVQDQTIDHIRLKTKHTKKIWALRLFTQKAKSIKSFFTTYLTTHSIMRHGRAKAARKTLKFFRINANIKPPYKVLVDGNFIVTALRQKVPVRDRISKVLQNQLFDLFVCRSILDELSKIPGEVNQQARQWGLDECKIIEQKSIPPLNHDHAKPSAADGKISSDPSTTSDSAKKRKRGDDEKTKLFSESRDHIHRLVSECEDGIHNRKGFLVATQDENLSDKLRNLPNIPILHLSRGVLLLEAPSAISRQVSLQEEKGKQQTGGGTMTEHEKEILRRMKDKERRKREEERSKNNALIGERRRHKAKGPNPLSCKKRKKEDGITTAAKYENK
jgi:U3 small nucleolar RNA-associated protein 23